MKLRLMVVLCALGVSGCANTINEVNASLEEVSNNVSETVSEAYDDVSNDVSSTYYTRDWSDEDKQKLESFPHCKDADDEYQISSCIRRAEYSEWLKTPEGVAYREEKQKAFEEQLRKEKAEEARQQEAARLAEEKRKQREEEKLAYQKAHASTCNSYWVKDVGQELVSVYRAPDGSVGCVFFMWHQGMVVGNAIVEKKQSGNWVVIN